MNNSNNKKTHKKAANRFVTHAITAGGVSIFSMLGKSQEERRNRI